MSYHLKKIKKGVYGEFSKIKEEYEELEDAISQDSPILVLCEMADIIGAIEAYSLKRYNITLDDILKMKKATKRAFLSGLRKSNDSVDKQ